MWNRCIALLGAAALCSGLSQAASAADLALKAPPPPPAPIWTWTGFYIGVNGGAGFGQRDATLTYVTGSGNTWPLASYNTSGFLGGVQLGYNWQMHGSPMVFGIEGSFDWANINGSSNCIYSWTCTTNTQWISDVAGRIGFTADRALIYVKGGAAWANTQENLNANNPTWFTANGTTTRVGALLGAGVEYAFMPNWSAKIEYDFIDFGTQTLNVVNSTTTSTYGLGIRETINEVKFGVNYRFGGGAF
jgi:outer membrane immunogenic protein